MKKKTFLFITVFVMMIGLQVNAESKTEFELVNEFSSTGDFTEINFVKTQKVGENYIVAQKNIIKKVNKNGIKSWQFEVNQRGMDDLYDFIVDGKYVYVTHCFMGEVNADDESVCYIKKLNIENGNVVKTVDQIGGQHIAKLGNYFVVGSGNATYIVDTNLEIIKQNSFGSIIFTIDNNNIYMIGYEEPVIKTFDSNLNEKDSKELNRENCEINANHINNFIKVGDNFYIAEFSVLKIDSNGVCSVAYNAPANNEYGKYYLSITKAEDYIVVGGSDYRETCGQSDKIGVAVSQSCEPTVISVFDKDFNYIEDLPLNHDSDGTVKNLYYENGILLAKWVDWNNDKIGVSEYVIKYKIESKTDGNGKVEVVDSAFAGDEIVFKVTAKKGYTLKSIKVTGKVSGNTIEISAKELDTINAETGYYSVSRNGFIMPGEDVLIEATFEKEIVNPDTGLTMTLPIVLLIGVGIVLFVIQVKKTKRYI